METSLAPHFAFLCTCLYHAAIFWGHLKCSSSWKSCRMLHWAGLALTSSHHQPHRESSETFFCFYISDDFLMIWFCCTHHWHVRSDHSDCILFPWTKLLEDRGDFMGGKKREMVCECRGPPFRQKKHKNAWMNNDVSLPTADHWGNVFLFERWRGCPTEFWTEKYTVHSS